MTHGAARQRGYALLIVLWSLALLALLGTQVLATSRQETQLARNLRDSAVLEAAANGAVQRAIFATLDSSAGHWPADGITRVLVIGGIPVAVRIDDEAGKVNPNYASTALLQALLSQVGADPATAGAVAAAITQWRDATSVPGHPSPAVAQYTAAGRAYAPTGAPFASLDELGAVLGTTPALLAQLRPHLTVFTDGNPIATQDSIVARALAATGQSTAASGGLVSGLVAITADAHGPGAAQYAVHVIVETDSEVGRRPYRTVSYQRQWNTAP
jgi:general secretion pathway protein K